ncbi:MAG: hypothetical protein AAF642_16780 [Pseudomonadota bacterium]
MRTYDYIIIGNNIGGLAFVDTILSGSDATIALIDNGNAASRHHQVLPRVINQALRDESIGASSFTLKDWRETHLAHSQNSSDRNADLQSFCAHLLNKVMRASGRVQVFQDTEHFGGGRIRSRATGIVEDLRVRARIVDATRFPVGFHKTFIPGFSVAAGVKVIRPFNQDTILNLNAREFNTVCVLGGGRMGTEMVLSLLDLGVPCENIRWVKSRDPWMLALAGKTEPAPDAPHQISLFQEILKAMAYASSPNDLCLRLEDLNVIVRTSDDQTPTCFMPHLLTRQDAQRLCGVKHVIRKGQVHAISEIGMVLSRGAVPMPDRSLYLDCTGHGGAGHQPGPIFQTGRIDLAEIRLCDPSFSAAMIAAIELLDLPTEEKNKLCVPIRGDQAPELFLGSLLNHHAWFHDPNLRTWLESCRLDGWLQTTARRLNQAKKIPRDLSALRAILPRAIINLESMIQTDEAPMKQRL